jgi:ATP-dependent Clp protease ATP-binding subunit ClpA
MDQRVENTALEAARRRFSPEFLNRIDHMIVFRSLSDVQLRSILDMELMKVQDRVLGAGHDAFLFHLSPTAKDFLLTEGIDRRYGARHLKRAIERHLVQPLANLVASGQVQQGDSIAVDIDLDGPGKYMCFARDEEAVAIPVPLETRPAPVVMAASMSAAGRRLTRKADSK